VLFEPCQCQIFFIGYNYEVKNAAENEDLNNKTLLTDQEIDVFVEEQRNPISKARKIPISAILLRSFKNSLSQ